MPATILTPVAVVGPYPALQPAADSLDFVFVAADASNGNRFVGTGREVLIAQNTGAGARTFTITSVADSQRRTGDVTAYSVGAGEFAVFAITAVDGWKNSDGYVYISGSHAEMKFAVLRLP